MFLYFIKFNCKYTCKFRFVLQGDTVLKVTARDGDKGTPRQIKYGLVSEGNPFIVFFTIGIETGKVI